MRYPLGALLAQAHARFVADCESRLADAGYPDVAISHGTNILRHLSPGTPMRVADLVPRSGVTKQAISQQVAYLAEHGYLAVSPDERDRRSRVVLLTERGVASRRAVRQAFVEVHRAWRESYGENRMRELFDTLAAITEFEPAS
ncbi:MarR family winged helix-turn-helix transcriptional regulator [Gulosibacter sp. 10]|uniref:MarR family winged helix-turn-helix transcriptional regulator n=1 Tax=Gulosibacter sp. 10 TaxID=1255570 RepID=UPI00097EA714|nr:MarR family transcriptional regulator [Gulosibacter sp. 10]SJM58203.1 Transcriptional regulator, MarR family [Gulosibacter sp. 10]